MQVRFSWFAVGLIVVGTAMVLSRVGLVRFEWPLVLWSVVALAGILKVVQGFTLKRRGSAFWGTLLFALGGSIVLDRLDVVSVEPYLGPTLLFIAVGTGFFLMFLVAPKAWHTLVPAVVFLGLGSVMLMAQLGYVYRWDVEEVVHTYWPVALILFGGSLLLSRQSA